MGRRILIVSSFLACTCCDFDEERNRDILTATFIVNANEIAPGATFEARIPEGAYGVIKERRFHHARRLRRLE